MLSNLKKQIIGQQKLNKKVAAVSNVSENTSRRKMLGLNVVINDAPGEGGIIRHENSHKHGKHA